MFRSTFKLSVMLSYERGELALAIAAPLKKAVLKADEMAIWLLRIQSGRTEPVLW